MKWLLKPKSRGGADPFLLAFGIYGGVGIQLAAAVVLGLLAGDYLDDRLATTPWLTLVGLVLGAFGGFYNLIKILSWNQRRKERGERS